MPSNPRDVALAFVHRINHHDVGGLVALMSKDHRFVDGLGQEVKGREQMEKGWSGYFSWFPDYSINVDDVLSDGNMVAMFGTAEGTYAAKEDLARDAHWKIPAAWKAVVRDGRIAEWRVYADNEPVWKIMGVKRC
jgi:ketosteroid isomerase-like protein